MDASAACLWRSYRPSPAASATLIVLGFAQARQLDYQSHGSTNTPTPRYNRRRRRILHWPTKITPKRKQKPLGPPLFEYWFYSPDRSLGNAVTQLPSLFFACLVNKGYHTVKGRFGILDSYLTRIRRTPQRLAVSPLIAASSLEARVAGRGRSRLDRQLISVLCIGSDSTARLAQLPHTGDNVRHETRLSVV